jgi:two-component system response regulator FlrC
MRAAGTFREDLYHRLAVFPVRLPPLRERRQDILPLTGVLLARIAGGLGRPRLELDEDARRRIAGAAWPGNVRELANALERAAILAGGDTIEARHLTVEPAVSPTPAAGGPVRTLVELERDALARALAECGGNRRRAAERLGIGLRTLYEKLKRYGLS